MTTTFYMISADYKNVSLNYDFIDSEIGDSQDLADCHVTTDKKEAVDAYNKTCAENKANEDNKCYSIALYSYDKVIDEDGDEEFGDHVELMSTDFKVFSI